MTNNVSLRCITSGEFKVNHLFKGKDNKTVTVLETTVLYTSEHKVINRIKVIVIKGGNFEKTLKDKGKKVLIEGEIHNFNKNAFGKRISEVFIKAKHVELISMAKKEQNEVKLEGKLCGEVIIKHRHSGLCVGESKIKVRRATGGFDYIQLVAFNDKARLLQGIKNNSKIKVKGRIHSRTHRFSYQEDGVQKEVERIALEVCVHELLTEERASIGDEISSTSIVNSTEFLQSQKIKASKYIHNIPYTNKYNKNLIGLTKAIQSIAIKRGS